MRVCKTHLHNTSEVLIFSICKFQLCVTSATSDTTRVESITGAKKVGDENENENDSKDEQKSELKARTNGTEQEQTYHNEKIKRNYK